MSVIERLERDIESGHPFRSIYESDIRALIAVAKAAQQCNTTHHQREVLDGFVQIACKIGCPKCVAEEMLRDALAALGENERDRRDARIDPRPGDLVLSNQALIEVEIRGPAVVFYRVKSDLVPGRFGCTIEEWRIDRKDAEVLHVAD